MKCPFCGSEAHRVVDKRAVASVGEIRRRRECLKCLRRFTTYERVGSVELIVIKRDGRKEIFSLEKLRNGIARALEKRPAVDKVNELTEKIERRIRKRGKETVASKLIGQMVLSELKRIDTIAYLRFASVYRRFEAPEDFTKELTSLEPK